MTGEQLSFDDALYEQIIDEQEDELRSKMNKTQLRGYRIAQGEIAPRCPKCGKRDVELEHHSQPDMIGETFWVEFTCCGYTDEPRNTHLEYDANGRVIDVG